MKNINNNNIEIFYCDDEICHMLKSIGFNAWCPERITDFNGITRYVDSSSVSEIFPYRVPQFIAIEWIRINFDIWIYSKQGYKWEWYCETVSNIPKLLYSDGLEDSPEKALNRGIERVLINLNK